METIHTQSPILTQDNIDIRTRHNYKQSTHNGETNMHANDNLKSQKLEHARTEISRIDREELIPALIKHFNNASPNTPLNNNQIKAADQTASLKGWQSGKMEKILGEILSVNIGEEIYSSTPNPQPLNTAKDVGQAIHNRFNSIALVVNDKKSQGITDSYCPVRHEKVLAAADKIAVEDYGWPLGKMRLIMDKLLDISVEEQNKFLNSEPSVFNHISVSAP